MGVTFLKQKLNGIDCYFIFIHTQGLRIEMTFKGCYVYGEE